MGKKFVDGFQIISALFSLKLQIKMEKMFSFWKDENRLSIIIPMITDCAGLYVSIRIVISEDTRLRRA